MACSDSNAITKLYITDFESQFIIEPNPTTRGSSFPVKIQRVVPKVEKYFGVSVSMNVVAAGNLYG